MRDILVIENTASVQKAFLYFDLCEGSYFFMLSTFDIHSKDKYLYKCKQSPKKAMRRTL